MAAALYKGEPGSQVEAAPGRAWAPKTLLLLGVVLLSLPVSGPSIRYVAAPALAVVLWRIVLSWPVLCGVALARGETWPVRSGVLAGLFLAGHWVGWVLAVQRTLMASASILISTGALWAAVLSRPLLGEQVSRLQWAGLGLALAGVGLIVSGRSVGRHSLEGDLLALAGALAWVGYTFVGRRARQRSSFWGYTATVYATAAILVLAVALAAHVPLLGLDGRSWLALGLLAIFPTLIGHGGLNYLLRFFGPARLGLLSLTEPVITTAAAWPLFGEVPCARVVLGGLCALSGVGLGVSRWRGPASTDAAARAPER